LKRGGQCFSWGGISLVSDVNRGAKLAESSQYHRSASGRKDALTALDRKPKGILKPC
jgi:hypothetical protein